MYIVLFFASGGLGGWNSNGCETRSISHLQTTCFCDHLTHFAVLLVSQGYFRQTEYGFKLELVWYFTTQTLSFCITACNRRYLISLKGGTDLSSTKIWLLMLGLTCFCIVFQDVSRAPISEADSYILTIISYVGCGISSIFLGFTLLTYLVFE